MSAADTSHAAAGAQLKEIPQGVAFQAINTGMKPIMLAATPRSGSTVIQELFYGMGRDLFGYQADLRQYFTVIPEIKTTYQVDEAGVITYGGRTEWHGEWCDVRVEKPRRLAMLESSPHRYLIKFFPSDVIRWPAIMDHISRNYRPLYIDRRDRLRQFISYITRMQIRRSHFAVGAQDRVGRLVVYRQEDLDHFCYIIDCFNRYRSANPGRTIFYEDFMAQGGDARALAHLAGIPLPEDGVPLPSTMPTPYEGSHEGVLINADEWRSDLGWIVDRFAALDGSSAPLTSTAVRA